MSGGIIRVKKDANYFTASNEPFNDKGLSWEARGVLGYLLSKTDGWEVRDNDLINQGPAGGAKIGRILDELKASGYLRRFRERRPDGTFEWTTEIYESPKLNPDSTDPDLKEWAENKRQRIEAKRKRAYERQKQKQSIGVLYPSGDINEVTIGVLSTPGLSTSGESPHIVSTELPITESLSTDKEVGKPKKAQSPAFRVYTGITDYFKVNKHWREKMTVTVGETPENLSLWGRIVEAWTGKGYFAGNVKGMLDYFERREIPGQDYEKVRQNGQYNQRQNGTDPHSDDFREEDEYFDSLELTTGGKPRK